MMIETQFTPLLSSFGGVLIGLSAVFLMATLGRVMGATGILAGALQPHSREDWNWRAVAILGMISGPLVVWLVTGSLPAVDVPVSNAMLAVGGLIVGVGVTFGSGCTSGHGVCGLARFSRRSLWATVTFMAATIVTVFVIRHVIGA